MTDLSIMRSKMRAVRKLLRGMIHRTANSKQPWWECPVCKYKGPFANVETAVESRRFARCPACSARERHRLQYLVMEELFRTVDLSRARMLHFAPETFFDEYFRANVRVYETADISRPGVDHRVDICELPFESGSYDLVYASHVLEHVQDDLKAISEIRRVLGPSGVAILPVPIVVPATIEYAAPNPHEDFHVRAPGEDYFDRYARYFGKVVLRRSGSFPEKYQCHIHGDRSNRPTAKSPLLPPMPGKKHEDVVPICFVSPEGGAAT